MNFYFRKISVINNFKYALLGKNVIKNRLGYDSKPFYIIKNLTTGIYDKYTIDPQYPYFTKQFLESFNNRSKPLVSPNTKALLSLA